MPKSIQIPMESCISREEYERLQEIHNEREPEHLDLWVAKSAGTPGDASMAAYEFDRMRIEKGVLDRLFTPDMIHNYYGRYEEASLLATRPNLQSLGEIYNQVSQTIPSVPGIIIPIVKLAGSIAFHKPSFVTANIVRLFSGSLFLPPHFIESFPEDSL